MKSSLARYRYDLGLVAVAVVWGATFVMVKDAVRSYPPFAFLGIRFAIAALAFGLMFPRLFAKLDKIAVIDGIAAGVFLTAGYVLQTVGLMGTGASKAGFLTGMFVVITPALQVLLMRKMPGAGSLVGVALATTGLVLLSGEGASGWTTGDTFVLLCAFAFSMHFIVVGKGAVRTDIEALTFLQLVVTAVFCLGVGLVVEKPGLPSGMSLWGAIVFTGVFASAVAYWVQTAALRHIQPTRVALILITEPVFAGIFGFALLGERLRAVGWAGCGLILAGMIVSEVLVALKGADSEDVLVTTEGVEPSDAAVSERKTGT